MRRNDEVKDSLPRMHFRQSPTAGDEKRGLARRCVQPTSRTSAQDLQLQMKRQLLCIRHAAASGPDPFAPQRMSCRSLLFGTEAPTRTTKELPEELARVTPEYARDRSLDASEQNYINTHSHRNC